MSTTGQSYITEMIEEKDNVKRVAVITGADGGMGTEITREVAATGMPVIMVCYNKEHGEAVRNTIVEKTGNKDIEVMQADFSSMKSVATLAATIKAKGVRVARLMNNAGTLETHFSQTEDGIEHTVSVNYMAPYLFTRLLLPIMERGTRIVNMVSCTYAVGKLDFPDFFTRGRKGGFWRIPIYSNTKLALLLFTLSLAKRIEGTGITVNAADPGVVSTPIIAMHMWFDPLTDIFFRPFIRTPRQGADTAIRLLLDDENEGKNGTFNLSGHTKQLSKKYLPHRQAEELWDETEKRLKAFL
jgi:NAD(P)-dependent dehydrogenase (short-subunit alcohol dehydrogenase family)